MGNRKLPSFAGEEGGVVPHGFVSKIHAIAPSTNFKYILIEVKKSLAAMPVDAFGEYFPGMIVDESYVDDNPVISQEQVDGLLNRKTELLLRKHVAGLNSGEELELQDLTKTIDEIIPVEIPSKTRKLAESVQEARHLIARLKK